MHEHSVTTGSQPEISNIERFETDSELHYTSKNKGKKFFDIMKSNYPSAKQKTPFNLNRYVILICCIIYVTLTGSIYYGWPGFSNMLFREDAYLWLCPKGSFVPDKRYSCEAQDTAVQRLFQIAMPCQYMMSLVAGTLIDNLGPKFTALLGQSINFSAWLLLSFANKNFNVYVVCFVLIGMGADTGFLPTLQTSNLFPGYSGVVIALLGAANSASFAVPTIMDLIQKGHNIPFESICYGYMIIIFSMWCYAFLCIPKKSFFPLEAYANDGKDNHTPSVPEPPQKLSPFKSLLNDIKGLPENLRQSREQFFSKRFLAIAFYFCTTSLIFNFYMVSGEQLLTTKVNTFYGIINPFSFVPIVVYGKMVDTIGPVKVMGVNTTFGLLSYILANMPWLTAKYLSTITFTIYVSIYTSQVYFFVKDRFEDRHFGKLVGTASISGGFVVILALYLYDPLTKVTFNGNFIYVSIFMIVLCFFNYGSFYFMSGHSKLLQQKAIRNQNTHKVMSVTSV